MTTTKTISYTLKKKCNSYANTTDHHARMRVRYVTGLSDVGSTQAPGSNLSLTSLPFPMRLG